MTSRQILIRLLYDTSTHQFVLVPARDCQVTLPKFDSSILLLLSGNNLRCRLLSADTDDVIK